MNQFTTEEIVLILFAINSKIEKLDHTIENLKELENKGANIIESIQYWQNEKKSLIRIQDKIKTL